MSICCFLLISFRAYGDSPYAVHVDHLNSMPSYKLCAVAVHVAESIRNIPYGILQAVALTESGTYRREVGLVVAWPWTITVNGVGHYYPTQKDAMDAVLKFKKKGINNIDVGCLQVNLKYHGKDFGSLNEMFDPIHNVAYGATYLAYLYQKHHASWDEAIKFYHSSLVLEQKIYHRTVYKNALLWKQKGYAKILLEQSAQDHAYNHNGGIAMFNESLSLQARKRKKEHGKEKIIEDLIKKDQNLKGAPPLDGE